MDDKPLQLALREMHRIYIAPAALLTMAAVGVVLGLSGPFGTYFDMGPLPRLGYWLAVVYLTFGVGNFTAAVVMAALPRRLPLPLRIAVGGLAAGVPVTLVVLAFNALVYGRATMPALELWPYCTAISLVVVAMARLSGGLQAPPQQPDDGTPATASASAAVAPPPMPPILERLPAPRRGALLALSVADHYVEVITERGSSLVLMRLADAIRETAPVAGLQIHRSHWVALDAVAQTVRHEGRLLVELANGMRLPVSRTFAPAAREAGIFA